MAARREMAGKLEPIDWHGLVDGTHLKAASSCGCTNLTS